MQDLLVVVKSPTPEQRRLVLAVGLSTLASSAITATIILLTRRQKKDVSGYTVLNNNSPFSNNAKYLVLPTEDQKEVDKAVSNGNAEVPKSSTEIYESESSARQYMEFHYTPTRVSFAQKLRIISESYDFPIRVAQKFKEFPPQTGRKNTRALDIGCATGASVLEMSKYFSHVIGIDYSEIFIHLAQELIKEENSMRAPHITYTAPDQGDITVERSTRVPLGTFPKRCQFFCGDAMHLLQENNNNNNVKTPLSGRYEDVAWYQVPKGEVFDAVLAANLLCRVPEPHKLLNTFHLLLHPGGILVLASPYSWWEGATPKECWVGGRPGGPRSEVAVKFILEKHFELLSETEEAFLIRDHVRRYQLGFSHCTVWRRK